LNDYFVPRNLSHVVSSLPRPFKTSLIHIYIFFLLDEIASFYGFFLWLFLFPTERVGSFFSRLVPTLREVLNRLPLFVSRLSYTTLTYLSVLLFPPVGLSFIPSKIIHSSATSSLPRHVKFEFFPLHRPVPCSVFFF